VTINYLLAISIDFLLIKYYLYINDIIMEDKDIKNLDVFLDIDKEQEDDEKLINSDKSIVEKVSKKIITEDGRQLLL